MFIIKLEEFFNVKSSHLFAYNLLPFHVFMDDVQAYIGDEGCVSFDDILRFVDTQYSTALQYDKHFWCCVDLTQSSVSFYTNSLQLLFDESGVQPPYNIPILHLNKVLRNSCNIIPVVMEERERLIGIWENKRMPNSNFSSMIPGHNITGEPIIYHQLQLISDEQCVPFVLQMVELELNILLNKQPAFQPSDVAIVYAVNTYKNDIEQFLQQKFHIQCQTIEEVSTTTELDALCWMMCPTPYHLKCHA